jgi:hypothetical protein
MKIEQNQWKNKENGCIKSRELQSWMEISKIIINCKLPYACWLTFCYVQ